jgi:hypothetical protein
MRLRKRAVAIEPMTGRPPMLVLVEDGSSPPEQKISPLLGISRARQNSGLDG